MSGLLSWLTSALGDLERDGLFRRRRRAIPHAAGWVEVDGRRLRNFSTNDYLDLAGHPRLIEAAAKALGSAGAGARASALVAGRTDWHARLEDKLAEFEGQSAAIIFPTGYAANVGTIAALVGKGDAVFSDRMNHASLIDGCRLSGAAIHVYDRDDLAPLDSSLASASQFRRRLIVTDSIFSMDGVCAPLSELCALKEKHSAALLIDEAHATGVLGAQGRGVAESLCLEHRIDVRVGTLSKALGSLGGFVAGSEQLVDWLWNRARTQVFSTALPPSACAAAAAAIDLVRDEPWRRERVMALSRQLREMLAEADLYAVAGGVAPIVPVILKDADRAMTVAARLEERGFFVPAIRPPSVPAGTSRLRITLSAAHAEEDVVQLVQAVSDACAERTGRD